MLAWDDIRFFLRVYRTGSLSAAGRELRVNQSTVGRRINAFEEALGAKLFDRTPEGFVLNAAGETLLPHAERVEEEVHVALMGLTGHEAGLHGSIRITAPETFGARFVGPLLVDFLKLHPDIDIELVAENRVLNLSMREADLSLRFSRPEQSNLIVRKLVDVGAGLYASKKYLEGKPWPTIDTLHEHELVGFDESSLRWPEARWLKTVAPNARARLRLNTTHAQLFAAEAGFGIANLQCYLAEASPNLVRVLGAKDVGRATLYLVLHKDLRPSARIRTVIDFLVGRIEAAQPMLEGPDEGVPKPSKQQGLRSTQRAPQPAKKPGSRPRR